MRIYKVNSEVFQPKRLIFIARIQGNIAQIPHESKWTQ